MFRIGRLVGCRRIFSLVVHMSFATTAWAVDSDSITIDDLNTYIQSLSTGEAGFVQENPDGSRSTGILSFDRPWRGRLDYDRPDEVIVIAEGLNVAVYDLRSNIGPSVYPLSRTPLMHLLAKDTNLADGKHFRSFATTSEWSFVELATSDDLSGAVTLRFRNDPLELAGWVFRDPEGVETSVDLGKIDQDVEFGRTFFSIDWHRRQLYPDR